uniref:Uncharacterized protein n=1 Tax=viral metagenome TaxID=1070528 RepID=A0A6C0HWH1_9ZZZZ
MSFHTSITNGLVNLNHYDKSSIIKCIELKKKGISEKHISNLVEAGLHKEFDYEHYESMIKNNHSPDEAIKIIIDYHDAIKIIRADHDVIEMILAEHDANKIIISDHDVIKIILAEHYVNDMILTEHDVTKMILADHDVMKMILAKYKY